MVGSLKMINYPDSKFCGFNIFKLFIDSNAENRKHAYCRKQDPAPKASVYRQSSKLNHYFYIDFLCAYISFKNNVSKCIYLVWLNFWTVPINACFRCGDLAFSNWLAFGSHHKPLLMLTHTGFFFTRLAIQVLQGIALIVIYILFTLLFTLHNWNIYVILMWIRPNKDRLDFTM